MFTDLKIAAGRRPLTPGEARVSAILGLLITLFFAAAIFEEFSAKKLSILFYFLFWVPMLVLHELGHAVAAKALGWRVREIVIGFGRTLWQWQIGETLVKIKLAPVEGYVLPAPAAPRNLRLKSTLIYAAGPGAELLLLAAMIALLGWDTVFNRSDEILLVAVKSLALVILVGAGFNLLPFRTEGAVSDGLGILSSPFMSDEDVETRLLFVEIRDIRSLLENKQPARALQLLRDLIARFPLNVVLQLLYGLALAENGEVEAARDHALRALQEPEMTPVRRREWLLLQARIELLADEPAYLVLDLALQKALKIAPNNPETLAIKGASLVRRMRNEEGGNLLAEAWRRNDGSADDAFMLAYLAIAAHRCGQPGASAHFRQAFEQINRSRTLQQQVSAALGDHGKAIAP